MNKLLVFFRHRYSIIGCLSALVAIGFLYFSIIELRVWLTGNRVDAKILKLEKLDDDKYRVWYDLGSNEKNILCSKKAYKKLHQEEYLKIITLNVDPIPSEIIFLQLNSRNNIIGLVFGVLVFGFVTFKIFFNTPP